MLRNDYIKEGAMMDSAYSVLYSISYFTLQV